MIEQLTVAGPAGQRDNLPTKTLPISLKNNFTKGNSVSGSLASFSSKCCSFSTWMHFNLDGVFLFLHTCCLHLPARWRGKEPTSSPTRFKCLKSSPQCLFFAFLTKSGKATLELFVCSPWAEWIEEKEIEGGGAEEGKGPEKHQTIMHFRLKPDHGQLEAKRLTW